MRSIAAGFLGVAAFLVLAVVVLQSEADDAPPSAARSFSQPLGTPLPTIPLPTPRPFNPKPCSDFLDAVRVPPGVELEGGALLHAILFAYQEVAPIWEVSDEEGEKLNTLLEACLRSDPTQPQKFPRDDLLGS